MDTAAPVEDGSALPVVLGLGTVALIAGVAAIAAVVESTSLAIDHSSYRKPAAAASDCRACGIIASVRSSRTPREAVAAAGGPETVTLLLASLGGALAGAQPAVAAEDSQEVLVRMDDGSERAVRERSGRGWVRGERVRVIAGNLQRVPPATIEPLPTPCAGSREKVLIAWMGGRHYCLHHEGEPEAPRGVSGLQQAAVDP